MRESNWIDRDGVPLDNVPSDWRLEKREIAHFDERFFVFQDKVTSRIELVSIGGESHRTSLRLIGAFRNMKDTQKCVSFLRLYGCFLWKFVDFEALQALLSIVLKTKLVSKLVSKIGRKSCYDKHKKT